MNEIKTGNAWPNDALSKTIFDHFTEFEGQNPDEAGDSTGALLHSLKMAGLTEAALAPPPVSERERELEGALRRQADNMAFVLNHASLYAWHDKFVAELEEDRALLTAQPQEPV